MRARRTLLTALAVVGLVGCARGASTTADPDGATGTIDADPAAPDAGTCPRDPCALVEQCGCGAAQVCDLDFTDLEAGETTCRDVLQPGDAEANCDDKTECAGGWSCFGGDEWGQCRAYCDDDLDCPTGGHCIINVTSGGEPVPGAALCTKPCIPENGALNRCPGSPQLACRLFRDDPDDVPASGDEYWLTDCVAADGDGLHGTNCASGADVCAPGYDCFDVDGGGKQCRQICDFSSGRGACLGGRTCTEAKADPPTIGLVVYGTCE
jgi:hypothetical protein